MTELENLQKEIALIKERNKKVELEKAWDTGLTRKIAIIGITYTVMVIVAMVVGVTDPFVSAIIPILGFFLSVQSLPFIKKNWLKKI